MNVELTLKRHPTAGGCTLGELSLNGRFFCWTMEDPVRPAGVWVLNETAIPAGTYPVTLEKSPRLRVLTPRLGGAVAGRGILIHWGNGPLDTKGCILVGLARMPNNLKIYKSQEAFEALMHRLLEATTVTLTIH